MRPRLMVVATAMLATVLAGTLSPATAHAGGFDPGCQTTYRAWKVFAGSPSTHVMDIHGHATICWDSDGRWRNGPTDVNWTITNTTWGSLYGFDTTVTQATNIVDTLDEPHNTHARVYEKRWDSKDCILHYLSICGRNASFSASVIIEAPASFGKPYWGWSDPQCTNGWCDGHMHFDYNEGAT